MKNTPQLSEIVKAYMRPAKAIHAPNAQVQLTASLSYYCPGRHKPYLTVSGELVETATFYTIGSQSAPDKPLCVCLALESGRQINQPDCLAENTNVRICRPKA